MKNILFARYEIPKTGVASIVFKIATNLTIVASGFFVAFSGFCSLWYGVFVNPPAHVKSVESGIAGVMLIFGCIASFTMLAASRRIKRVPPPNLCRE